MFDKKEIVPVITDTMTFYESTFALIKNDLCNIANTYLEIAFKVWQLDERIRKDGKKCKYKNIVEACALELGFKKSTTYNMLNIVKTYGVDPAIGKPNYYYLCKQSCYTYSQLVEMLSLGEDQRAEITPDTPVSAIRMLKKSNEKEKPEIVQTSGKSPSAPEPSKTFQTSGKSPAAPEPSKTFQTSGNSSDPFEHAVFSLDNLEISIKSESNDLYLEFNKAAVDYLDKIADLFCDFQVAVSPCVGNNFGYLRSDEIEKYTPSDLEKRVMSFMVLYRQAYYAYHKHLDSVNNSAV